MKTGISGFPEFLPNEQIVFTRMLDQIKHYFEMYGFIPMDTPAVERISTLLSNGNDSEIYGLYRIADENSKKDLGLRFDLTVPLARYVSSKFGHLVFPHRRYQIGPVWRGERPQFGRYRQFYQCDIDVVGEGELSLACDAEIVKVFTELLRSLGIPSFTTKMNNRKILQYFLVTLVAEENINDLIRVIDKRDKITDDEFTAAVSELGVKTSDMDKLYTFLSANSLTKNADILDWLKGLDLGAKFTDSVLEFEYVINLLKKFGMEDDNVKISMGLARGLTYYTGNVFETVFDNDVAGIGSIAAGGRYDNLVSTMSDKNIQGVGASIGLTRMLAKLLEQKLITCNRSSTADLLVTNQENNYLGIYMDLSTKFRNLGIKTETYLQNESLGDQLTYANKKGIPFVLIANESELQSNVAILRNMYTKEQISIKTDCIEADIADKIKTSNK